jgi:hypothetical protein
LPIQYRVDAGRRLIVSRAAGTLTDGEVFAHQAEIASRAELAGFDELIDMSSVERIDLPSIDRVRALATHSAATEPGPGVSRIAVVAPDDLSYGLGRMYQTYRHGDPSNVRHVGVFRTLAEALAFLRVAADFEVWPAGS